jgi:hypothetical protein
VFFPLMQMQPLTRADGKPGGGAARRLSEKCDLFSFA